ncbi:hypothetical protein [Paractinoplanes rishiriensis]|uniref:Uncharacterized protein n=1 Tax=Paractinoplanes rishiriensis TaxID=1050105 RepID=A0A919K811_9ACTN|nr:hypothetical protein [Actinoplanes rishiriensis]GIF01385.1 hypothetical protein Ari01nite_88490 [Actinoplanes rishiriensis]
MAEDDGNAAASRQLEKPTLADARTALERLYGPHLNDVWASLLVRAGLTGEENDLNSFHRLVTCMCAGEPITRICGRSLEIRAATYSRLTAAAAQGKAA